MATNFVEAGHRVDLAMSGSAAVSGVPQAVGSLAGVPITDIADGDTGAAALTGVWEFTTALAGQTAGTAVDWDVAGAEVVATGLGDFALGNVYAQPTAGKLRVLLNGLPATNQMP